MRRRFFFCIPGEEPRILEHIRTRSLISEREGRELFRIGDIRHIVEVYLDSAVLGSAELVGLGGVSDSDEVGCVVGMEICGVSGNLQLSEDFRVLRVAEIYREERIDLFKSHQIEPVPDETRTLEILSFSYIRELSEYLQLRIEHEEFA